MRIINFNDNIRNSLFKVIEPFLIEYNGEICVKDDNNLIEDFFNNIKEEEEVFGAIIQSLIISSYLLSNITLHYYKDDEDALSNIEYLESYDDIYEFANDFSFEEFKMLILDLVDFMEYSFYEKRELIEKMKNKNKKLFEMCPLYVFDVLYYCNTYNTDEIMDIYKRTYNENIKDVDENLKDDCIEISIADTSMEIMDAFEILSEKDYDNYKYLICELAETFYKYTKYKKHMGYELSEEEENTLFMIENDLNSLIVLSIGNISVTETLVSAFIRYNLFSKKEIVDIDKFYMDDQIESEKLKKVRIKCKNIKEKKE